MKLLYSSSQQTCCHLTSRNSTRTSPCSILEQRRVHSVCRQVDVAYHAAANEHVLNRALLLQKSSNQQMHPMY